MKDYGTGIIHCHCSVAMARGKTVKIRKRSAKRVECPGCKRMVRVRLVTLPTRKQASGATAAKKRKRREKVASHVATVEAENRELKKQVKKQAKRIVVFEQRQDSDFKQSIELEGIR